MSKVKRVEELLEPWLVSEGSTGLSPLDKERDDLMGGTIFNSVPESQHDLLVKTLRSKAITGIYAAQLLCYKGSRDAGWWSDLTTGQPKERNIGEMMMLMVSELSEAFEGERKNMVDTHLPHRRMAEVELADAIIRILDYAGGFGYDVGGALVEKLYYNQHRDDHKIENRKKDGGKKF